ncbi:MAG TPA: VWA domain-containing protein [Blastocatellia bacterium]|nr:VWA domain-containing protein [Blastocatellia bacterium]
MAKSFLSLALSIAFTTLAGLIAAASPVEQPALEREFSGDLNEILIDNRGGATEAETWPGEKVKVVATRRGGSDSLDSDLTFENPQATTLKITVRPTNRDRQISLKVFVPSKVRLLVKGSREPVTVKGQTNGLSVDTDSGNITLYMSQDSNAVLALRAPNGSINLRLPVTVSGVIDSTQLDGRIGKGGPGVVLRSSDGNINILPDKSAVTLAAEVAQPATPYFYPAQLAAGKDEFRDVGSVAKALRARKEKAIDTDKDADAIRLRTRLVNLNVKVLDQFGRTVPNLTKENFEVLEDGVRQDISHFEPVTAPVSLVLLMDLSGSIKSKLKELKKAAKNFVDTLRPDDRVAVVGFTRRFYVVAEFSKDKDGVKKLIDKLKGPSGGTAFYDSLWKALDKFDEIKETRKAVVVLTDGVDSSIGDQGEGSELEFDELVGRIEEEEVTIYPIYFDTEYQMVVKEHENSHEQYAKAREQLQVIADRTGGELYKAARIEDLDGVYQKIASELFTLYSVAYQPKDVSDERRWRRVSVKVNREGVKAKTRQGYRTN